MSLSSSSSSLLLNTLKKIYIEREQLENSPEKFRIYSDTLYQIWMKPHILSNTNNEGYIIIDYLEELILQNQLNNDYFILIINTLAKNEYFYQIILNDHKRFERLFNSSIPKVVCLMRYIYLLYYYCPLNLIPTIGLEFYRFVVENYLHKKTHDIDELAVFSSLIYQFYENTSKNPMKIELIFIDQKDAIDYSINVIDTLLHQDLNPEIKLINSITKTIGIIWEQNSIQEGIKSISMHSIEYLFDSISTQRTCSFSILPLFSYIPLDLADTTLTLMFSNGRLNGERLSIMIKYLIELIDAPIQFLQCMSYDTWITGLCNALVNFHQHEYLNNLIDETIIFFINHLFNYQTCNNAFRILFWFVIYDKRIQTFRLLLNHLPKFFQQCQINHNDDLKNRIIELYHIGITLHPEYNISNEIILKQILQNFPQPDLNILANYRITHARFHSIISENEKKAHNRLGIINLGNTCYVNSVLQALYQCDLFRKYILEYLFNEQIVLKELQIIFAQLYQSKRPYINAINLVKIARPAWFSINEQQDCAEFLGYLLDTIKDEEKTNKKLSSYEIERLFTIRTCQINRCQCCSIESYREELSNYLFLPIPIMNHSNENKNYNQSAIPITIMKNGLKFYAALNENSALEDQTKSIVTSSIQSLNLQFIFDYYFQKEELKDDNQYRCEHCKSLQDAERYIILQTAPEYLILSLNRFEYDKNTNIFRKVFTKINYPKVLNVSIYPSKNSRNHNILTKYCLVLIIVHTGYTLHGGHYYVYAREVKPLLSKINLNEQEDYFSNDEWFLLNDDLVTLSSYEAMIENCAQYTSATPYILFYKRIDQQRIEEIERTKQIHVHENLLEQIHEDNIIYEREQEK